MHRCDDRLERPFDPAVYVAVCRARRAQVSAMQESK
jgi:hypothetical protein